MGRSLGGEARTTNSVILGLVPGIQPAQVIGLKESFDPTDVGSLDARHKGEHDGEWGCRRRQTTSPEWGNNDLENSPRHFQHIREARSYTPDKILSAAFSAIMITGELVLPETIVGMIEASTTRNFATP